MRTVSVERFLTLTIDPKRFGSPAEAEKALHGMFSKLAKRIRRRFGNFEYLTVIEWTKKDWPHLHVVCRSRFIPQKWLSSSWCGCGGGYIVHIRRVRHPSHVYHYILKYLLKQAGREVPKGFRRIRTSRKFFEELAPELPKKKAEWMLAKMTLEDLAEGLAREGYQTRIHGDVLHFGRRSDEPPEAKKTPTQRTLGREMGSLRRDSWEGARWAQVAAKTSRPNWS